MRRYGAQEPCSKQMDENHLFLMRLQLLMVMIKAKLVGYPAGRFRKQAVMDTSTQLHRMVSNMELGRLNLTGSTHLFRQRVKLLCVMATAIISEEYPLGLHRREAVLANIDNLVQSAFPSKRLNLFHDVLKAA